MVKRISSLILGLALLVGLNAPASAQNFSSVQVLNGSCSAPSFTFNNDPDSGFYLVSAGTIAICINGAEVGRITSNGLQSTGGSRVTFSQSVGAIDASTASYADAASEQAISGDLNVAAGDVVLLGTIPAIAEVAIPAGTKGALSIEGIFQVPQKAEVQCHG